MTNCEGDSEGDVVTCMNETGHNQEDGGGERGQSPVVTKRKYGNPEAPPETKMLLVTKNKKVRHSQACDRCRLKKVKCDGLKPKCSQCTKANFRCTTSDRLTRRGFPKGYTEMLEMEVVRLQKKLDERSCDRLNDGEVTLEEPKEELKAAKNTEKSEVKPLNRDGNKNVVAEPQFPFINDTFHYYDNYTQGENFMGHRTWDLLQRSFPSKSSESTTRDINEKDVLRNSHLLVMTNLLQLQPNSLWLPRFLTARYDDNLNRLRNVVLGRVENFSKFQNSLIPLLYPFDKWKSSFEQLLSIDSCADPVELIALLFIVQISWGCLDDALLFKVTKMICSSSTSSLKSLQALLLGCFYFMGGQRLEQDERHKTFASELLHLGYGMVLDSGLYINSKKLVPVAGSSTVVDHDSRVVTFWIFQFLDSWWSLIQGLPKSNFIVDEFHPRSMSSLDIPSLKPLSLLLNFTTESLDGCNLLHTLSTNSSNGKSKLIYLAESFRQLLVQWKLYHQLQDHEDELSLEETYRNLTLTKPDVIEIQLTLFYLVISLLSSLKFENGDSTSDTVPTMASNSEETAFEILSLYYLILVDQSDTSSDSLQPLQFNILHILPCPNRELINSCILILHAWAMAPQGDNEQEGHLNWKYDKYQKFLIQWCQLYFMEDPQDPILAQLSLSFKIHLKEVRPNTKKCIKQDYLQKVDQFINRTSSFMGRSNLLRSNSHAVMDQFDMFSQIDLPNNILHDMHPASLRNQNLVSGSPQAQLAQNENNNIIDMSNFRSQILIEHEETDDGYAEDDDEEEDEDTKPLEIPFSSKRAGSLFHTKHNLPPSHRGPANSGIPNRRRTVDHIILEDSNFGSQSRAPAAKKQRGDSLIRDCMQNNLQSTDLTSAYPNYSVNTPARKALSTNSGGKNMPSNFHETILPPPPLPQHETLFGHTINLDGPNATNTGSTNSSHTPQIVETPRAFVDMLLLQPSAEARAVIKSPPPCSTTIER